MTKPITASAPNQVNMVGEGTVFEGTLRTEGDVRISGRILGKLSVGGRAFVSPEGTIEGEVEAAHAKIGGRVEGDLIIQESLVLEGTAHIEGTIKTARLIVEEGAVFNGQCQMGQGKTMRVKADLSKEIVSPRRVETTPDVPRPEGDPNKQPEQRRIKFVS